MQKIIFRSFIIWLIASTAFASSAPTQSPETVVPPKEIKELSEFVERKLKINDSDTAASSETKEVIRGALSLRFDTYAPSVLPEGSLGHAIMNLAEPYLYEGMGNIELRNILLLANYFRNLPTPNFTFTMGQVRKLMNVNSSKQDWLMRDVMINCLIIRMVSNDELRTEMSDQTKRIVSDLVDKARKDVDQAIRGAPQNYASHFIQLAVTYSGI